MKTTLIALSLILASRTVFSMTASDFAGAYQLESSNDPRLCPTKITAESLISGKTGLEALTLFQNFRGRNFAIREFIAQASHSVENVNFFPNHGWEVGKFNNTFDGMTFVTSSEIAVYSEQPLNDTNLISKNNVLSKFEKNAQGQYVYSFVTTQRAKEVLNVVCTYNKI
jgi:hypothetical protein